MWLDFRPVFRPHYQMVMSARWFAPLMILV
jgi:hypothetical protein